MRTHPRMALVVGVIAVAATVLAGCGGSSGNSKSTTGNTTTNATSGYDAASNKVINASTKQGGTMNLLAGGDCDSWDPQRTYYGWCWNMQRLFTRSLIGYSSVNGTKFTLAPDLATSMGTHNADFTQWSFTLKTGLKWSNGQPITPQDVQYGISRLWATDVINGGPASYFLTGIKSPPNYTGPYKMGVNNVGMTVTATTITFHLTGANADFDYLMAMAASAPVPDKTEGGPGFVGADYTKHPMASGPFEIQSYQPANQITFVRNPNWSQSTDTIHHPLADKIVLTIDTNPADIGQKLAAGTADGQTDKPVNPAFQAQILTSATLKKNADDPVSAFTQYLTVMPSVIPNLHCRLAVFYAVDKAGFLRAYGGPTAGQVASSMTPPGITGNDPTLVPYPSGSDNSGDVTKAKAELQQCGKPSGFSTKFAYSTPSPQAVLAFKAEQSALSRVGINITAAPQAQSSYYSSFIGSPRNIKAQGLGIALAGWGADFPTPVGFYQSITNGNAIVQTGNSNYPSLNDQVINKILDNGPSGVSTAADWHMLNVQLMTDAVYIPMYWGKNLYYRNPRLTNITTDNALAFGIYDWVNVGVGG
ncbi:MAG: ABC transporter substrate-binding protein [Jatrophihabitantaceae bacterium]